MYLFFYDVIGVFDFYSLLILFIYLYISKLIEVVLSTFHTSFTYFFKLLKMRFLVFIFCTICTFHCSNFFLTHYTAYFSKLLKLRFLTHYILFTYFS